MQNVIIAYRIRRGSTGESRAFAFPVLQAIRRDRDSIAHSWSCWWRADLRSRTGSSAGLLRGVCYSSHEDGEDEPSGCPREGVETSTLASPVHAKARSSRSVVDDCTSTSDRGLYRRLELPPSLLAPATACPCPCPCALCSLSLSLAILSLSTRILPASVPSSSTNSSNQGCFSASRAVIRFFGS